MATKLQKASIAIRQNKNRDMSPNWDGAQDWSTEKFTVHFRQAMKWYNLESSGKELKPQVINWMAKNSYTKAQIQEFKKTKDNRCSVTVGAIAACLNKGMPAVHTEFNNGKDTSEWLRNEIAKIVLAGKEDVDDSEPKEEKPQGPVITIQERLRDAALAMTEEIEEAREKFHEDMDSWNPKEFKILNLLKGKGAKAAHARIIKDFYSRTLDELTELASGKADEQLREGYSHIARKNVKKLIEFFTEIDTACTMLMEEAKVTRKPRKAKAVSKDKLVAKLKYKKTDEALKLVSINPTDIIGMKELWVYNTKTRKLGKYVAAEFRDLGVKGTSLIGFDENKSICKTLRKPAEQLKEFKAAGKVALRKFLEEINAVDTKMNGRISEETMLLKVA